MLILDYLGDIIREYLKACLILILQFGLSLNKKMFCCLRHKESRHDNGSLTMLPF